MTKNAFICFIMIIILLVEISCYKANNPIEPAIPKIDIQIAKWYNNHSAAITLAYDHGAPNSDMNPQIQQLLLEYGMTMDYEIVTARYQKYPVYKDFLLQTLIPLGFGYFGHGHEHVNHDKLSYEEAFASFKLCCDLMNEWGLKPVAYAYPEGAGHEQETQNALADAGFLCGRMHIYSGMTNPYIVPDNVVEPENWYQLPTAVMQDYEFAHNAKCVNDNEDLIPYLEETVRRTAWIILTYHAIGQEQAYGFFKWEEFQKNVATIKKYDFWNAPMNNIILYIRERQKASVDFVSIENEQSEIQTLEITVTDSLPNDFYDQSLTLMLSVPEWYNKSVGLFRNDSLLSTITFDSCKAMISIKPDENKHQLIPLD